MTLLTGTGVFTWKILKNFLRMIISLQFQELNFWKSLQGYAKAIMNIEKKHLNALKTVQGGAIFTLADLTFAAASNAYGTVVVAINANISFVKAAAGKTLTAKQKKHQ